MKSPIYDTLLTLQQALGNCVTPPLRAVNVEIKEKNHQLFLNFYYDMVENIYELEDFIIENMVEVDTYTKQVYLQNIEVIQLEFPKKIPVHGKFAFLRYEQALPEVKRESRLFLLQEDFPHQAIFRLDMQEALLGKVTKALRHVSVDVEPGNKKLIAQFIYDGEISELNLKLANSAIRDSRISFTEYEIDSTIERVDYPNRMQYRGKWLAYHRQESIFTDAGPEPAPYLKS